MVRGISTVRFIGCIIKDGLMWWELGRIWGAEKKNREKKAAKVEKKIKKFKRNLDQAKILTSFF